MPSYADFLFVTADPELKARLAELCAKRGFDCRFASDFDGALDLIDQQKCKVVVVDIADPFLKGLQILEWLRGRTVFSVIGVFAKKTWQPALNNAFRLGATEVYGPVVCADEKELDWRLSESLARYERARLGAVYLSGGAKSVAWVGADPLIRHALEKALAEALGLVPLLIRGEAGSGKKQLAEVVLAAGGFSRVLRFAPRSLAPHTQKIAFAKLTEGLAADSRVALLVDETEFLHPEIQETLADYLKSADWWAQAGQLRPKLKVIATTASDPDFLVRQGTLRADLGLILAANSIFVPPLRDRKSDLPLLVTHFLETDLAMEGLCYFSDDAMAAMSAYDWPGNVAELKNLTAELAGRGVGRVFKAKDLPNALLEKGFYARDDGTADLGELNYNHAKKLALNKFNREYISILLTRSNNNLTVAAEIAGMDRSNFKKIVKKYYEDA